MKIAPFETEHFFDRYEFTAPYQLCNSDCESLTIAELLALAGLSLEDLGRERLIYTPSRGRGELRESIAALYRRAGAEQVLTLGTPVEGIYLAARALLEPGDEVIVLCPAYDALINLFEHVAGAGKVRRWHFRPTQDGWSLDIHELRELITPQTRMLVVNFPHNPTGFLPDEAFQTRVSELAERHGFWLFCDEMYFGLVHSGTPTAASFADISDRAVVLSGLSKTHGLPGLRCGWLVVSDQALRESLLNWKFYTSICPPVTTEFLAVAALSVHETLCGRSVARIERNLAVADAFFSRWTDLFVWRWPMAGSTALVEYDVPSVEAVAHRLVREKGILIMPAKSLGSDDRHMRLGLGRSDFPSVLERFENWLHDQPSGR
jgi:aspartate/methionine/tyrosine aminotransferase